jgi:large repetitive protein
LVRFLSSPGEEKNLKRLVFAAAVAVVLVVVVPMSGSAASFVDWTPCPAQGPLLVCPVAQVGQGYNIQLMARDGCDLYRWEIVNGELPPGLKMDDNGKVTGTPTEVAERIPWVWVHDRLPSEGGYSWCIGDNHSERQFVFRVVPGVQIKENSVPGGTIGQAYSQQLSAQSVTNLNPRTASPATATWSLKSGTLPTGMTLSSSGLLSGTPTAEGQSTFVLRADVGGDVFATATYTINVRQPLALNATITKGEVSVPFSVKPTATGGAGTYTWSVKGALPAGLALAADGTIAGTPTLAGRHAFTLTVTDTESRSKSVDITLVVAEKLAISTSKLTKAKVGKAYRARIIKIGGVAPIVWSVRGKLPKGVKFAPRLGLLLGTPTKAGTYRITVTITDSLAVVAEKTLTLVVK